jgi:hypothetical protein
MASISPPNCRGGIRRQSERRCVVCWTAHPRSFSPSLDAHGRAGAVEIRFLTATMEPRCISKSDENDGCIATSNAGCGAVSNGSARRSAVLSSSAHSTSSPKFVTVFADHLLLHRDTIGAAEYSKRPNFAPRRRAAFF